MINTSQASGADLYYQRDRPSLRSWVTPGRHRILDLGCGSGAVGRKLLETGAAAELIGVELFPDAAREAAAQYRQVHVGDIEQLELPYRDEFDYVLCGDILEHLKDPYTLVRRIHGWLKEGGVLISSVPNVRYWQVAYDLVARGTWSYVDAGIMDRTHLRFFTRRTCREMIEAAGFRVESTRLFVSGRRYLLLNRLSFGFLEEFLGTQVQMRSIKSAVSK